MSFCFTRVRDFSENRKTTEFGVDEEKYKSGDVGTRTSRRRISPDLNYSNGFRIFRVSETFRCLRKFKNICYKVNHVYQLLSLSSVDLKQSSESLFSIRTLFVLITVKIYVGSPKRLTQFELVCFCFRHTGENVLLFL